MALGSVLMPFTGQNIGAKLYDRAIKAQNISHIFAQIYGIILAIIIYIFAPIIAMKFGDDQKFYDTLVLYLRIMPLGYGLYSSSRMVSLSFNAINQPIKSLAICFIQIIIFRTGFSYIGSFYGVAYIIWGIVISNFISGIGGYAWIIKNLNQIKNKTKQL
jgi:Na+-driven multidrug efflux pump